MTVIETLSAEQISNIINGNIDGIFKYIFNIEDVFYKDVNYMCREYYLFRSSNKKLVKRIDKLYSDKIENIDKIIGELIRSKYIDKWNRIYNDILLDFKVDESVNIKHLKNGNNTNTNTFNTTDISDGSINATNNNEYDEQLNKDVYGYNSIQAVGDSVNSRKVNEKVSNDNTVKSKTEKYGTNTDNNNVTETNVRTGHSEPVTSLIEQDISMRRKIIFYDIIESDIDKIFTLSIY